MAVMGGGMTISSAPSLGKAKDSASKVFGIIDEKSTIDVRSTKGVAEVAAGEIEFCEVDFKYPTRDERVLRRLKLKIPATKKIALVGHSGCGKSTIANLLLRFYDVTTGGLKIDGVDIRDYNIHALRKQIGIVMQEPLLFNMSIKENILYGNNDATDLQVR
jgi:ABC-type multidrug transport system fused ATPase/permease subunit